MKRTLLLTFLLLLLTLPALAQERQLLDQVVAVVNDDPITQSELDMLLRPIYEQYHKEIRGEQLMKKLAEARRTLLNQLIEDRLVFQEAKTQGIQVDESDIDAEFAEFKKRFKNDDELEEAMKKEGMTLNNIRERIRRQNMIRRLHDTEIRSKVVVSPLEVEDYYKAHPEEFSSEASLLVRSLTVKKNEEAREKGLKDEDAKKKIEVLRTRIESGEDFAAIAHENSEDTSAAKGGLAEWMKKGSMIPEIEEVIFKMQPGQLSQVIETPMGYHVFRVEERKEGFKENFEQVREKIYSKLFLEKAEKRFEEWIEGLKKNAYISIRS